jgi:cyclohexadienyl dehydratase
VRNAARFQTLARIDQPGMRVIVNPGGTNEQSAVAKLHKATIVRHPDNNTIFDQWLHLAQNDGTYARFTTLK